MKATSLIQFKRVIGEKANTQATCMYCHKPSRSEFKLAKGAPEGTFVPPPGTFMTTPTSHATCFQCHWQKGVEGREQPPLANECARCHRDVLLHPAGAIAAATPGAMTGPRVAASATTAAPATSNPAVSATPRLPTSATSAVLAPATPVFVLASSGAGNSRGLLTPPPRVSPKFVHELDAHKKRTNDEGKEVAITCLQCHGAARKAETLESLRSKESGVQLLTCSSSACHTAVSGSAQLRLSVYRELRERAKDAKFDCALCHAPPVSLSAEVPCSHYAAVYASAVKEKKSTKGVEQITPPQCAEGMKGEVK